MNKVTNLTEFKFEKITTQLIKKISSLIENILNLKKEMREQGLFRANRCLAECAQCGIYEDVIFNGRLVHPMPGFVSNKDIRIQHM